MMAKSYRQRALARRKFRVETRERLAKMPMTQAEESVRQRR